MFVLGSRTIIEETPLYFLLANGIDIMPGFVELVPKRSGNTKAWVNRVKDHLKAFSDSPNSTEISKEDKERHNYKQGNVVVTLDDNRVEISLDHPNRGEVAFRLIRLNFPSMARKRKISAMQKVDDSFV